MPHVRLCIAGCPPYTGRVHNFPSDPDRRDLWLKQFGKYPWDGKKKYLFACHRHFSSRMRLGRKIHSTAYPDQNLTPYNPKVPYKFKSALPYKNLFMELELRKSPLIEFATVQYNVPVNSWADDGIEGEDIIVINSTNVAKSKANQLLPTPKCLLKCTDARVLYRFPTKEGDFERRKQWFFLLGMDPNMFKSNNIYVCDRHFDEDMVDPTKDQQTVYPNKNLPPPLQDSIPEDMEQLTTCIQECVDYKRKYSFPSVETDLPRRRRWLIKFGREPEFYNHDVYACDRHFSDAMRIERFLTPSAIPDQNIKPYIGKLQYGYTQNGRKITEAERAKIKEEINKNIALQREQFKKQQKQKAMLSAIAQEKQPQISIVKDRDILDSLNSTVIKSNEPSEPLSYVKLNTLGIFIPSCNGYIESLSKILSAKDPLDLDNQIPLDFIEPIEPKLDLKVYHIEKSDYDFEEEEENVCNEDTYEDFDWGGYEIDEEESRRDAMIARPTRSLTPIEDFLGNPENSDKWNHYAHQTTKDDFCITDGNVVQYEEATTTDYYDNNKNLSYNTESSGFEDLSASRIILKPQKAAITEHNAIGNKGEMANKTTHNSFTTYYLNHLKEIKQNQQTVKKRSLGFPYVGRKEETNVGKKLKLAPQAIETSRLNHAAANIDRYKSIGNLSQYEKRSVGNYIIEEEKLESAHVQKDIIQVEEEDTLEVLLKKCYALTERNANKKIKNLGNKISTRVEPNATRVTLNCENLIATAKPTTRAAPEVKLITSENPKKTEPNATRVTLNCENLIATAKSTTRAAPEVELITSENPQKTEPNATRVTLNCENLIATAKPTTRAAPEVNLIKSENPQKTEITCTLPKSKIIEVVGCTAPDKHPNLFTNTKVVKNITNLLGRKPLDPLTNSVAYGTSWQQVVDLVQKMPKETTAGDNMLTDAVLSGTSWQQVREIIEKQHQNSNMSKAVYKILNEAEANAPKLADVSNVKPVKLEVSRTEESKLEKISDELSKSQAKEAEVSSLENVSGDHSIHESKDTPKRSAEEESVVIGNQETNKAQENKDKAAISTKLESPKPDENKSALVASTTQTTKGIVNAIKDPKMPVVLVKVGETFLLINRNVELEKKNVNAAQKARELINANQMAATTKPSNEILNEIAVATSTTKGSTITNTNVDRITPKASLTTGLASEKSSSAASLSKPVNNLSNLKTQDLDEILCDDDEWQKKVNDDLLEEQLDESLPNDIENTEQLWDSSLNDDVKAAQGSLFDDALTKEAENKIKAKHNESQSEGIAKSDVIEPQAENLNGSSTPNITSQDSAGLSTDVPACVMNCQNFETLFAFPSRVEAMLRRHFWFLQVGLDLNIDWYKTLYICNNHFDRNMFINANMLNQCAYPSENLKDPTHTTTHKSIAIQTIKRDRPDLSTQFEEWQNLEHEADTEITRLKLLIRLKQEAARILSELNSGDEIS
ncbi:uncharacterized protein [Eurosta solidaginis]|uniref:uncharacterized protein n=1 Tax=Eurosta solidaginis TaxID=178769 RepID=UPI0035311565